MDTSTFNKGVQILLKRMDSNPEEFMSGMKWDTIVSHVRKRTYRFISEEEAAAVDNKLMELEAQVFTNTVMSKLLKQDDDNELSAGMEISNGGFGGPVTRDFYTRDNNGAVGSGGGGGGFGNLATRAFYKDSK